MRFVSEDRRYQFNPIHFGKLVQAKRGRLSLREAERRIGSVERHTLKAIEEGYPTDVPTFVTLCNWIKMPPNIFFSANDEPLPADWLLSYLGRQIEYLERELAALRTLLKKFENRNPQKP